MTFEEYMARVPTIVRAGAAYMDEQPFRDEWRQMILEHGRLVMMDDCGCVLGITTGSFGGYTRAHRMTLDSAAHLGFCLPLEFQWTPEELDAYYKALEREWMTYVRGEKDPAAIA